MVNLLKHGLLIAFVFGLFVNLYAQNDSDTLVPYRNGKKWGYMNANGDLVIKTKYQEAYPFENNRGRVKKKGKYGFIDKSGEVQIDFKYEHVSDFTNGMAILTSSLFYLDTLGVKQQIIMRCGGGYMNSNRYAVFQESGLKGILIPYPYDTLIRAKYSDIKIVDYVDVFMVKDTSTGKWGIISVTDSIIQPFIYDSIVGKDVRTAVWFQTYIGHKTGAINRYGELEAEAKYYTIKKYKYCYYAILENGPKGFIYKGKEYWKD